MNMKVTNLKLTQIQVIQNLKNQVLFQVVMN